MVVQFTSKKVIQIKLYKASKQGKRCHVTLDIGTCTGVTLLAVLMISEKNIVKLVDIVPVTSKKGEYLANICFFFVPKPNKAM